jgi:hypothetical protein
LQAAAVGALMIFLAGPIVGVVIYGYQGIVERNSTKLVEAGALALVALVGGGVGGTTNYVLERKSQRRQSRQNEKESLRGLNPNGD